MKTSPLKKLSLFITVLLICSGAIAQKEFQTDNMQLTLKGTSNLHNWEMKAVKCNSNIEMVVNTEHKITSIKGMNFTLDAKSLKSEWTAMDNNTYRALKTSANPTMKFAFISSTINDAGNNNYEINCFGTLTIAGTSKETQLIAKGVYNPLDKSFTVTGIKKLKMTDFNVQPPKALLGTIKTGDDISISYNIKFI